MKTLCLLTLIGLTGLTQVHAQTEKGRWTVGAQIGNLSYQNENAVRYISASITPSVGYFIIDGLACGLEIPFMGTNQKNTNDQPGFNAHSSSIGASPFVRYFLGKNKLKPYAGLAYNYSKSSYQATSYDVYGAHLTNVKGKSTALVPTIGVAYFINSNLGLTASFNYTISHQDQETTFNDPRIPPSTSTFNSDTKSLSLAVGFQLFFGHAKK